MPVLTCAGLNDSLARSIIRDLKAGYGVEDIGRRGTATEKQARYVVEFMRKHGILSKMYQTKGKCDEISYPEPTARETGQP